MKLRRASLRRARIEIIPMIDTVFFLLVFFMMASLSMTVFQGMPVSLPPAASGRPAVADSASLTVAQDGAIYLERQPVDLATLGAGLRARVSASPELAVVIHADRAVSHGRVVEVLDVVRLAGVGRLAIAIAPPDVQQ
jgi:biopolymer transport protein ExbD